MSSCNLNSGEAKMARLQGLAGQSASSLANPHPSERLLHQTSHSVPQEQHSEAHVHTYTCALPHTNTSTNKHIHPTPKECKNFLCCLKLKCQVSDFSRALSHLPVFMMTKSNKSLPLRLHCVCWESMHRVIKTRQGLWVSCLVYSVILFHHCFLSSRNLLNSEASKQCHFPILTSDQLWCLDLIVNLTQSGITWQNNSKWLSQIGLWVCL